MQEARALRLRNRIEERIATGVYGPGERLDETALAEQFGVSRTPVREALQQLAAGGMVELDTGNGRYLIRFSQTLERQGGWTWALFNAVRKLAS